MLRQLAISSSSLRPLTTTLLFQSEQPRSMHLNTYSHTDTHIRGPLVTMLTHVFAPYVPSSEVMQITENMV